MMRVLTLVGLLAIIYSCDNSSAPLEEAKAPIEDTVVLEMPDTALLYGFYKDSFKLYRSRIKRNEPISDILQDYNVDYSQIHELAQRAEGVFNVKHIQAGKPFTAFCTKDSLNQLVCLVYEKSDVEYVVFDLRDSMNVSIGKKDVEIRIDSAKGEIIGSLYLTLDKQDKNPYLAVKISEVFAWQIDFFRVQKYDQFKIIYETKLIDGKEIGTGQIKSAWFKHSGKEFYAFWYEKDTIADYFDEDGQSLRKAFLKAPLKYSRISSGFTYRRFHPVLQRYKAHLGTDYAAPSGTPIYAVGDGKVIEASYTRGNGNYVKIRHNGTYTTGYLHMSKKAVTSGTYVRQGDLIGYVGSTGLATGPHLCYRFYLNGEQVNPFSVEIPPTKPLPEAYAEAYKAHMDLALKGLNNLQFKSDSALVLKEGE